MNIFGEFLESLRGKQSLRDAAEKIGISHTYLRDLETGKKIDPTHETLLKLSGAYNVKYTELVSKNIESKLKAINTPDSENFNVAIDILEVYDLLYTRLHSILDALTVNDQFLDIIKNDIDKLREKYSPLLEEGEDITPSWIKNFGSKIERHKGAMWDLVNTLENIMEKYGINKEISLIIQREKSMYNGQLLTVRDKKLIQIFLDALFENRAKED